MQMAGLVWISQLCVGNWDLLILVSVVAVGAVIFFCHFFFFALGEVAARLAVSPPSTYQTYNMADPKLRAEIAQGANLNSAETNDRSAPATGTPLEDVRVFVCALWKEQECHLTHHGLLCPSRTVFSLAMAL